MDASVNSVTWMSLHVNIINHSCYTSMFQFRYARPRICMEINRVWRVSSTVADMAVRPYAVAAWPIAAASIDQPVTTPVRSGRWEHRHG